MVRKNYMLRNLFIYFLGQINKGENVGDEVRITGDIYI